MWKRNDAACHLTFQQYKELLKASFLRQHGKLVSLSFPRETEVFSMLPNKFERVFPSNDCSRFPLLLAYMSLIICWRVFSSSHSSRLFFILSSMLVTEYNAVVWSRLNFFPMASRGMSVSCLLK